MARKKYIAENVTVLSFAHKGHCMGRDEQGQIYLLENAVPGDVVHLDVRRKKKGLPYGRPKDFVTLSPFRTEARCDHFGECGGCKWQNFAYDAQLEQKQLQVENAVHRIGHLKNVLIEPIVPAPEIYYYRNKLEYSFSAQRWVTKSEAAKEGIIDKTDALGFHAPGVFDKVVQIETCHLQSEPTNAIRNAIYAYAKKNQLSFYHPRLNQGFLRNIIVRTATTGEVMLTMVFGESDDPAIHAMMTFLKEQFPKVTTLLYFVNTKLNDTVFDLPVHVFEGRGFIYEMLGEVRYKIGPKSFFQTNPGQAKQLYDLIIDYADFKGDEIVYDLYTGVGSIGLYVARSCKSVVGIEEIPQAIEDAIENAQINQISNARFLVGDVKDVLNPSFEQQYGKPDIIITDPPRVGMHKDVINTILQLSAPTLIYISCNPATQARDFELLAHKYEVIKIRPVDMFPHTNHIESVALLRLKMKT